MRCRRRQSGPSDDQSTDQYDRNDGWQVIQLDDKVRPKRRIRDRSCAPQFPEMTDPASSPTLGPGREPAAPAQNVCIKTSTLDEKMNGIQMIMTFAKALGQHFAPHADECFSLLLPLLTRYLDDNCRIVAGACISPLLNSLVEAHAGTPGGARVHSVPQRGAHLGQQQAGGPLGMLAAPQIHKSCGSTGRPACKRSPAPFGTRRTRRSCAALWKG